MRRLISTVLLFLLGLCMPTVPALDQTSKADALTGYTKFDVIVELLDFEGRKAGLTVQSIKTKVELELRRTGVTVDTNVTQYVHVAITVLESSTRGYAYTVYLAVNDRVIPRDRILDLMRTATGQIRDSIGVMELALLEYRHAAIWGRSRIGTTSRNRARSNIMGALHDMLNIFINDYLAVNPQQ